MDRILKELLETLNIYLKTVTGADFRTQRSRLKWMMPASIGLPLFSIVVAWFWKTIGFGFMSPVVMVIFAILTIIPWLLLALFLVALYMPLIAATLPAEFANKLKELNASPETAKKIARQFFDIITWLLFAYLYCFLFKVWNSIGLIVPLLLMTLFLIFSTLGGWVKPDPKFKQKLWKWAMLLIFVPTTLNFIAPTFFYHVFGTSLYGFSNKNPKTQVALEKLEKSINKNLDETRADSLKLLRKKIEKGNFVLTKADSALLLSARKGIKKKALPVMAWGTGKKWYKNWFDKDSTDSKKTESELTIIKDSLIVRENEWATIGPFIPGDLVMLTFPSSSKPFIYFKLDKDGEEALEASEQGNGQWRASIDIPKECLPQIKVDKPGKISYWVWKSNNAPPLAQTPFQPQTSIQSAPSVINLCNTFTPVPRDGKVAMLYAEPGAEKKYHIQVVGGIVKIKKASGGYEIVKSQKVKIVKGYDTGNQPAAYYAEGNPQVKVTLL